MIHLLLELQGKALGLAARTAALPFTALLSKHERRLLRRLNDVWRGPEQAGIYPEVTLSSLMRREDVVQVLELPAEAYHLVEIRLLTVAALARRAEVRIAFEIGTADGRTTRNLAANVGPTAHVYTLTIPLDQDDVHRSMQTTPIGSRFHGTPEAERITQLWGDSLKFDYTPYLGSCHLVFIDAGNDEASILANSETAFRLVDRSSSLIVWNDALRYGTRNMLPRLMRERGLPIHLISGTGLALLCFVDGEPVSPSEWAHKSSTLHGNRQRALAGNDTSDHGDLSSSRSSHLATSRPT